MYGLALYRDIGLNGPSVQNTVPEGSSATVVLRPDGTLAGAPALVAVDLKMLRDAWLVGNAQEDARLGLPLGQLASLVSPEPTLEPTLEPNIEPTAVPTDTTTEAPTAAPTAPPTAAPTARPTAAGPPSLGALKIISNGGGSYTFSWPKYTGSGFEFYKLVYGPWGTTPSYPASPYWACPGSQSENSWTGVIGAGDYAVRLQVVDTTSGKTIIRAQTPVVRLKVTTLPATVNLGALGYVINGDGDRHVQLDGILRRAALQLLQARLGGDGVGIVPSYPGGSSYWDAPSVGSTSAGPIAITAGDYKVRIQAIGYPLGSAYVYGQTTVLHLMVPPPATPTPAPSAV